MDCGVYEFTAARAEPALFADLKLLRFLSHAFGWLPF